MNNKEYIIF